MKNKIKITVAKIFQKSKLSIGVNETKFNLLLILDSIQIVNNIVFCQNKLFIFLIFYLLY